MIQLGKRQREQSRIKPLEHLSALRKEVPKPLATYDPKIEEEFLLKKVKKPLDERTLRRKTKEASKMAIKEITKDARVIQQEKQSEKHHRRALSKKNTYSVGRTLKDEI